MARPGGDEGIAPMDMQKLMALSPPPEVLALGQPEHVFVGSAVTTAVKKWGGTLLMLALMAMFAGIGVAFRLTAPEHLQNNVGIAAVAYGLSGFFVILSGLMIGMLWHSSHTSAYALFPQALALSRDGAWSVVPWHEVASFEGQTLRHYPHLRLRDGRKVPLQEGSLFANALYREVRLRVDQAHGQSTPAAKTADPTPTSVAASVAAAPAKESPWGIFICGIVLCVMTVAAYNFVDRMEAEGGSMRVHWILAIAYNIGGKWGLTAVCALVALGTTLGGMVRILNASSNQERQSAEQRRLDSIP
jgi:hypothetical protein